MDLALKKPIVFFDIESTGLSVIHDRIIEISFIKVLPDASEEKRTYLFNPTIPISQEATKVHGITNEKVANCPTFSEKAKEIFEFIGDADLSGFNALKFDIPMLIEEFQRNGMNFDVSKRNLVDVQIIFHKMEERTLSAAYKFYCDKEIENAHSADADTAATYEVFKAQLKRYPNLGSSIAEISDFTGINQRADLEGRIVYNDKNIPVFNFGKHKGKSVEEIFTKEPSYYSWMMDNDFSTNTKQVITNIKMKMLQQKLNGG